MNDVIDKNNWNRFLLGYTIYDCALFREKGFAFVLVESDDEPDRCDAVRILYMSTDHPMDARFGVFQCDNFSYTSITAGTAPKEYLAVDSRSQVFSANGVSMGEEAAIDQLIDMSTYGGRVGIITKVVRAAGQVYALGDYRKIYRRIGSEKWAELGEEGKGLPLPSDLATTDLSYSNFGFSDMSAFAADDMYAVGGKGDVWRFDGVHWHKCTFPTNAHLKTVCCAADGTVYITELNGSVWAGRREMWRCIAVADIAPGYRPIDSIWFNDRLYLGGQEGLWTIDASAQRVVRLDEVEPDAPNVTNSGRLDLSPDGKFLLTAGPFGACLHDGAAWRRLFSAFDFV